MTYQYPDARGHFGPYGGQFVAETLMEPLTRPSEAYARPKADPALLAQLDKDRKHYGGRPSPLVPAKHLHTTWDLGGSRR